MQISLAAAQISRMIECMKNPAQTVIEICGGVQATAEMANRHACNVRRWRDPKGDGLIPSDRAMVLLQAAKERGIELRPEHFFYADE